MHHQAKFWVDRSNCCWDMAEMTYSGVWRKDGAKSLVEVSALSFLQYFDTVGWVTGKTTAPYIDSKYPQTFCSGTSRGRNWMKIIPSLPFCFCRLVTQCLKCVFHDFSALWICLYLCIGVHSVNTDRWNQKCIPALLEDTFKVILWSCHTVLL